MIYLSVVSLLGGGAVMKRYLQSRGFEKCLAEREAVGEMPLLFCPRIVRVSQLPSLWKRACGGNQPNRSPCRRSQQRRLRRWDEIQTARKEGAVVGTLTKCPRRRRLDVFLVLPCGIRIDLMWVFTRWIGQRSSFKAKHVLKNPFSKVPLQITETI